MYSLGDKPTLRDLLRLTQSMLLLVISATMLPGPMSGRTRSIVVIALLLAVVCAGLAGGCRKQRAPSKSPPRVDYRVEKVIFRIAETELRVDDRRVS